ncbi:hypothetical protein [Shewanella frigidimarina]|mgnify:CR=1 FL=1|jgi:hypothetical protein|uniref:hypothetical protein n=1 Tax=Shewanella frigidimarina TaxID=56812 RepID=UPI003FA010D2|tara:strand:- start:841 stop:1029 length:189 start_codon:yes stop_codon:yes gene_type:complete
MMKDWIKKLLGRPAAAKRNKVHIDMRYEEHSYKSEETFDSAKSDTLELDDSDTESIEQKPTK